MVEDTNKLPKHKVLVVIKNAMLVTFRVLHLLVRCAIHSLPPDDPLRLSWPPRIVSNYSLLYNMRNEVDTKPRLFKYDDYIQTGLEFDAREDRRILVPSSSSV